MPTRKKTREKIPSLRKYAPKQKLAARNKTPRKMSRHPYTHQKTFWLH